MNILYLVIVYLYIALLTFSGIASLFLPNFPKRWSLVLMSTYLFLFISVSMYNLYTLIVSLTLVSIISWYIAPKITTKRNLSHHIIRLFFHIILTWIFVLGK